MTETLKTYQQQQQKVLDLLGKLDRFVQQGSEFGLTLSDDMKSKLSKAIHNVKEDKLKIALIGGFSEGKTSIAAAWLGKLDKSSMKISAAESSNEVTIYDIGDDCLLIDTPGLYGYKEQENDNHKIERYKDITKKYVSEAHIVLYVMNSKNPIKESHKDDLIWLFKDLNLLDRTVFILSRFDEVADVEDEEEYQYYLKIKQDNVANRLKDFLNLTIEEMQQLSIVGVSANPFDEGVEYWLENPEEFQKLSHIGTLQQATKQVVQKNGGLQDIVHETRKSVFSDIILREMPLVEQKNQEISKIINELDYLWGNKQKELNMLSQQITSARSNIKKAMNRYFEDLLLQAQGVGLETANDFLIRAIGEEGCLVQSQINTIFQQETASVSAALNQQIVKFNFDLEQIDSAVSVMARQGIEHILKNVKLNNTTVLAARDGIKSAGEMIGFNFGKALNFKPYGAIKLANKLNGAFAVLGVALEVYDTYKQQKIKEDFQNAMKDLKANLALHQKKILELIDSPDFIPMFFQGYIDLENSFQALQNQKSQQEERKERFEKWKAQGDIIEAEFKEIL